MVNAKRKQLATVAVAKESSSADEDSWVLVKKQKITIFIPPLSVQPPPHGPSMKQLQSKTRKAVRNNFEISLKQCSKNSWIRRNKIAVSTVSGCNDGNHLVEFGKITQAAAPHPSNEQRPLFSLKYAQGDFNFVTEVPSQLLGCAPSSSPVFNHQHDRRKEKPLAKPSYAPQEHDVASESLKSLAAFRRKDCLLRVSGPRDVYSFKSASSLDLSGLQNQRIRALNVEKKLEQAGGLRMWLISQGLGKFIQMFQREKIGRLQLLNLTMGKLKDMGANAVGPRRKLMHAIDTLCQPCYF